MAYAGGTGDIPGSSSLLVNDGAWHHVVATTLNGGGVELYLDGSIYASAPGPAALTENGNNGAPGGATPDFFIGANPQTGAQNREWPGLIDDVALWGRVLSAAEISEIYNAGISGRSLGQIPEPATIALIGLLGLGLLLRRRRR